MSFLCGLLVRQPGSFILFLAGKTRVRTFYAYNRFVAMCRFFAIIKHVSVDDLDRLQWDSLLTLHDFYFFNKQISTHLEPIKATKFPDETMPFTEKKNVC